MYLQEEGLDVGSFEFLRVFVLLLDINISCCETGRSAASSV